MWWRGDERGGWREGATKTSFQSMSSPNVAILTQGCVGCLHCSITRHTGLFGDKIGSVFCPPSRLRQSQGRWQHRAKTGHALQTCLSWFKLGTCKVWTVIFWEHDQNQQQEIGLKEGIMGIIGRMLTSDGQQLIVLSIIIGQTSSSAMSWALNGNDPQSK